MSEEAKLQDSIKKTQDLLGKYVKKPPLTEKLLKKPPFRFLHDVITAVIKETGFLKGLFTDEELISSNITDKDGKLGYLTKLIDAMKLITGQELPVRASKIVSGQEPIRTNELLQAIARSLDKKISSSQAIEHYKKSLEKKEKQRSRKSEEKSRKSEEKPRKTSSEEKLRRFREAEEKRKSTAGEEKPKRESSEEKQRKTTKKSTPSERTDSKDGEKREREEKRKKKPREGSLEGKSKSKESEPSKKTKRSSSPKKPELKNEEELQSMEPSKDSTESIHEEKPQEEPIIPPQVLASAEHAGSHQHQQEPEESLEQPVKTSETSPEDVPAVKRNLLRPPSARPPSARPGAPKLKGKSDFVVNTNGLAQMGDVHVIVENFDVREDDVEGMVVVESPGNDENIVGNSDLLNKELTKEHGYLVAQILETQRELVNEGSVEIIPNKVEIEWEAGMRKDKEAVIKEVDKLRGTIQSLTRTTNPLGKLMDFLQEDAEIMEKELWEWRSQFSDLREQLVVERNMMKESIKPLEESLKEIEGTIGGQMEKIFQTKANIMRNNQRIQKLLTGR
ncbi:TRAF3-interacting protein 1 [Diachasmimorpha longicaudata]|uniref:TRAF3-interacting protein 1 n=1 Tax=Diachasmimorpha longicaudata TaxID=58733 RepID=UPI0030B8B978